jgi:hypothetical protein
MIDYDRAELQAQQLLRQLSVGQGARPRRCLALRLACLIAGIEFILLLAGTWYMF